MATASGHTSAIRAKKVIGTNVKDSSGNKIGSIEDIVLDKESNTIMFAVVGFGGFLGMAENTIRFPGRRWTTRKVKTPMWSAIRRSNCRLPRPARSMT